MLDGLPDSPYNFHLFSLVHVYCFNGFVWLVCSVLSVVWHFLECLNMCSP
jgi:hypothetical protein